MLGICQENIRTVDKIKMEKGKEAKRGKERKEDALICVVIILDPLGSPFPALFSN